MDAFKAFPATISVKQLQAYLGHVAYYQIVIPRFSDTAKSLRLLLRKDVRWTWEFPQRNAFDCSKDQLVGNAVVAFPDLNKPFVIVTEAGGVSITAMLL